MNRGGKRDKNTKPGTGGTRKERGLGERKIQEPGGCDPCTFPHLSPPHPSALSSAVGIGLQSLVQVCFYNIYFIRIRTDLESRFSFFRLWIMASHPLVLCFSFSTPRLPASNIEQARLLYQDDFDLLDQVAVTDLTEDQRGRIKGILCTGGFAQDKFKLDKKIIDLLPNLKVISTPSTGVDHIDVEAATARGISVGHAPGHLLGDAVAEFAIGLLLASARSIVLGDKIARTTDFNSSRVSISPPPPHL